MSETIVKCPHCGKGIWLRTEAINGVQDRPAWHSMKIEDSALSVRILNCVRAGVYDYHRNVDMFPQTMGELAAIPDGYLMRTSNFGKKSLAELRIYVKSLMENE